MKCDPTDLVSAADIADMFKVTPGAVYNWTQRYATFPKPVTTVARGMTPLYLRSAVATWAAAPLPEHEASRPRNLTMERVTDG